MVHWPPPEGFRFIFREPKSWLPSLCFPSWSLFNYLFCSFSLCPKKQNKTKHLHYCFTEQLIHQFNCKPRFSHDLSDKKRAKKVWLDPLKLGKGGRRFTLAAHGFKLSVQMPHAWCWATESHCGHMGDSCVVTLIISVRGDWLSLSLVQIWQPRLITGGDGCHGNRGVQSYCEMVNILVSSSMVVKWENQNLGWNFGHFNRSWWFCWSFM